MKIVIIEDEPLTATDLSGCIVAAEPAAQIVAVLGSVQEAVAYFSENEAPDVIFSDIQLGDGLSFSIFGPGLEGVPVIFCTAYDEYALEAFKAAGMDYILKPFTEKSIGAALTKYHAFKKRVGGGQPVAALATMFGQETGKRCILVYHKDKIVPVTIADVAFFFVQDETVRLVSFNKQQYVVNKKLEEIERMVGT